MRLTLDPRRHDAYNPRASLAQAARRDSRGRKLTRRPFEKWVREHDDPILIRLWAKGVSQRDIAKHFGVARGSIVQHCRRLELPRRGSGNRTGPKSQWTRGDDSVLREMWADATSEEIARNLGVHPSCVQRRAAKLGLPRRKPGRKPGKRARLAVVGVRQSST